MTVELRAISVRQPWAAAIVTGLKTVENRTRNIVGSHRGLLLIHASKQVDPVGVEALEDVVFHSSRGSEQISMDSLETGALVGAVHLVGVHHQDSVECTPAVRSMAFLPMCSDWAEADCYHLELRNAQRFQTPIPARGQLGLWQVPIELHDQVLSQLLSDFKPRFMKEHP